MKRIILASGFIVLLLSNLSCSTYDAEELELLKNDDPRFRNMMELKRQSEQQIKEMDKRLAEYKSTMDSKVAQMRQAYEQERALADERKQHLRQKYAVNREHMEKELNTLSERLELKKKESLEVGGALNDIQGVLGRHETLKFSDGELRNLEGRKNVLERRIAPLTQEIVTLTSRTNLMKKKLKYL